MENETVSKNFIEQEIDKDLAEGVYDHVCTRFPPEPNGYLHIGHAKSILLNYGLAEKFADSAPAFVSELNSVLFPTFGNPTIPNFIFLYSSYKSLDFNPTNSPVRNPVCSIKRY